MKIIITGANGKMGKEVANLLVNEYKGNSLAAAIDVYYAAVGKYPIYEHIADYEGTADCIIDFSTHLATKEILTHAQEKKLPIVIATTGHTDEEVEMIKEASRNIPIFFSANMSVGIALLIDLAKTAAKMMPDADIEIIEKHHNRKLDAPSGTALLIADNIKKVRPDSTYVYGRHGQQKRTPEEIGIHAVRMGSVIGDHEVIISTDSQTISLQHQAHHRALFAEGAITAAMFLAEQENGLYTMKDLVG